MRQRVRQEIQRIISEYNLHNTVPVNLEPMQDLFLIRFAEMAQHGLMGALLVPQYGWPVSPSNRGRIVLDRGLSWNDARVTAAHEIGHALYHHPGNRMSMSLGLEDRHERQAWTVASMLLIPEFIVREEQTAERVAMVCEVPLFMAEIWQSINE